MTQQLEPHRGRVEEEGGRLRLDQGSCEKIDLKMFTTENSEISLKRHEWPLKILDLLLSRPLSPPTYPMGCEPHHFVKMLNGVILIDFLLRHFTVLGSTAPSSKSSSSERQRFFPLACQCLHMASSFQNRCEVTFSTSLPKRQASHQSACSGYYLRPEID